jgi:hypothetical protein
MKLLLFLASVDPNAAQTLIINVFHAVIWVLLLCLHLPSPCAEKSFCSRFFIDRDTYYWLVLGLCLDGLRASVLSLLQQLVDHCYQDKQRKDKID